MSRLILGTGTLARAVTTLVVVAVVGLIVLPAASGSSKAGSGLRATVVSSNKGPITGCTAAEQSSNTCPLSSQVHLFVYVTNTNPLPNFGNHGPYNRTIVPNAFVVSSVDTRLNGVLQTPDPSTPPPSPSFRPWSGDWPATVTCSSNTGTGACDVVGKPAILPGETTALLVESWLFTVDDKPGSKVFSLAIHGTLDGQPVTLTASAPAIQMTG